MEEDNSKEPSQQTRKVEVESYLKLRNYPIHLPIHETPS